MAPVRFGIRVITLLSLTLFGTQHLIAHDPHDHSMAEGIVKERLDFMERMGEAMGGLGAVARGKKEFQLQEVMANIDVLREQSGEAITRLFPEGTGDSPSEALPSVWQDWDKFATVAGELGPRADSMKTAIEAAGDSLDQQKQALMGNIRDLGTGCRNCHSDFRKKQDR